LRATGKEFIWKDKKSKLFVIRKLKHKTISYIIFTTETNWRRDWTPGRVAARQQRRVKRAKQLSASQKLKPAGKPEISNLKNMPNTNSEFEQNFETFELDIGLFSS